jgi:small conductance mechanosensitive channel
MNGEKLSSLLISSGLIVALTVLGLALAQFVARRALRVIQTMRHLRQARKQQLLTFVHILRWGAHLLIVVSAVLMLLSNFGVDVTPLLASAGVAGLAVSLGAQTLIKDLIGGFLVLSENLYAVGDTIQVGDVSGTVEQLTLRATYLRDVNGHLYAIPNGEVRIVANQTKGWSRALVEVGVAYEEDLDHVLKTLQDLAQALTQDPTFGPQLLETPQVLGPMKLGDWAISVQMLVKTEPGEQWGVARELRKRVNDTFKREGIIMPYPRQEVVTRTLQSGDGLGAGRPEI